MDNVLIRSEPCGECGAGVPSMWFSIELQATRPVPEWGGQPVRIAQEEDVIVGADGKARRTPRGRVATAS